MTTCLELVKKYIENFTQAELDEILGEIRKRQIKLIRQGLDATTAAEKAADAVSKRLRTAIAVQKRNAAINARVRHVELDYLREQWTGDMAEGFLALTVGSPKSRFGSRDSVDALQGALERKYIPGLEADLYKVGLYEVFFKGDLAADIYEAKWALKDDAKLKTLPPQAVEIAKIIDKWQDVARLDANRAGAWIGKLDNYIHSQDHSPDKLLKAGKEPWVASIKKRLDIPRMFPDGDVPDNMDDWLGEAWTNIVTGVRPDRGDINAERMAAFSGPGNLAKSLSQERVFHFLSAQDAREYHAEFADGALHEAVVSGLVGMAQKTGLMMKLGTNPWYNLEALYKAVQADLRRDPVALQKFNNSTDNGEKIKRAYDTVSGNMTAGAMTSRAKFVYGFNQAMSLAMYGGTTLTSLGDIATRASLLSSHGMSFFGELNRAIIDPVKQIANSLDSVDRRVLLASLGAMNESVTGNMGMHLDGQESVPGRLAREVSRMFRLNLNTGWTNGQRRTTLEAMGSYWGGLAAELKFSELSDQNRRALARFKIGDGEWQAMSKGLIKDENGRQILSPAAVRELDVSEFTDLAKDNTEALKAGASKRAQRRILEELKAGASKSVQRRILEDTREDVAMRLQTFYSDDLDSAIITPDARTRLFMFQGQNQNSSFGQAARLFWKAKPYPIAFVQRAFRREWYGHGKLGMETVMGVAQLMAAMTAFGYVSMQIKALVAGKEPRPADDYRTYLAAMAQGGAAGIYGDFLFGQSRYGQGFLATAGGPAVSRLDQVSQLYQQAREGRDVSASVAQLIYRNLPYNNLFYTKMATDYLFLYSLQEAMNPGYLERMERRQEQETKQGYWLRPSAVVN